MKKVFKILGYLLGLIFIIIVLIIAYIKLAMPNVGDAPDIKINTTTQKIERGKYLANHVMLCIDCHSTRNWNEFSVPLVEGTEGKGGETFDETLGFPGKYIAPNITPYHLNNWTDGEIFRAITTGVNKNGKALFSIMPYHNYGKLDKTDIESVIAYIRTLKPIQHSSPESTSNFPVNILINTFPSKPNFTTIPQISDTLNYGKYITTASGCYDCHTKQENGKFIGEPFAGNFEFKFNDGSVVRSSNLTPDKKTGIGNWSTQEFINLFKSYSAPNYNSIKVNKGNYQTVMPWTMYAGMKEEDLSAIFYYLKTLKPVYNTIEKFTPAK